MDSADATMERPRAFTPKDASGLAVPGSQESLATVERNPLRELATDEKAVSDFDFYFSRITSGKIRTTAELRARFVGKLNSNGYLYTGSKNYFQFGNGEYLKLDPSEQISISDLDQQEVLIAVAEESTGARTERNESEQSASALDFYAKRIVSGDVKTPQELKARFEGKLNSNGFLYTGSENYFQSENGEYLRLDSSELKNLADPQQKELLIRLLEDYTEVQADRRQTDEAVRGINFYARKILSGEIKSVNELRARFEGKLNNNGFLYTGNENFFQENGQYLKLYPSELIKIANSAQKQVLIDLCTLLKGPDVSDEVRSLIKRYADTGSTTDLTRLRTLMGTSETGIADRVEDVIGRYDTVKRRLDLKQTFYKSLFEGDAVERSIAVLATYEEQSVEDTALVAQLRDRALAVRRVRATAGFTAALAQPNRDFDSTLSVIDTLEKSSNQSDRACAQVLRQSLYRLELATFRDEVRKMITFDADPRTIYQYLDRLPIRPSVGDYDYVQSQTALKEKVGELYIGIGRISRLKRANAIRRGFATQDADDVISRIDGLADETEEEIAIKLQLLDLYKSYVAANKPEIFDERFQKQIAEGIEAKLKQKFISPELGKNKEAFRYLRGNFDRVINPLIESFRDDPRTKKTVSQLLDGNVGKISPDNPRIKYYQLISELEKQRPLTDTERAYIQSVGLLTLFNPYIVAAATAEFGVTSEFLRHHFDVLSEETQTKLKDGDYMPLIQVGTGPNGLAAFGEIVRNNPELARQALIVDSGEQPGGPFAIPKGPAWELNSANRRGLGGYTMPDSPNGNELKTVRAYGSPVARWYPGERPKGSVVRQGSINATVDYLPTPDDLSTARYPTNEELQTILALQTSILTQNLSLRTELVRVEPNPNQEEKGDKIATLKVTDRDGTEREVKLKTDGIFISSGLGEPTYGFRLEGSRAERVLEETAGMTGFPKITTTLEAFKALSDRTQEKKSPGKTLAIWGKGNSADTLIEFIGNIFQGDNPLVRDVAKIYIVSEGDLSARPRYALISDLKPRNGRGNLIEQVNARVSDVDFAGSAGDPAKREIVLLDTNGRPITDSEGRPISADSGIAATGFRPQLERIFESYLDGGSLRDEGENAPLQPISLPTNPDVAIAESFRADPNIILLGTASRPRFNSFEKLAQLPPEAREALLRNGAENAVAIGFRAPDTQAAVNIWLNSRSVSVEPQTRDPKLQIPLDGDRAVNTEVEIDRTVEADNLGIPNNVDQEDLLLSPLLAYNLGNRFDLTRDFTGNVDFGLQYDPESGKFRISFNGGDAESISPELLNFLESGVSDEYFQRYALSLLGKRRRDPKLDLNIAFKRGKLNPRNTYTQAT